MKLKTSIITGSVAIALVVSAVVWLQAAPSVGTTKATPAYIVVNTATPVLFTSQITDPSVIATGVNLLKTDAAGKTLSTVGVMRDDGKNGDAVAGDKTFSYRVTLNQPTVGQVYYRVSAAFKGVLQRVLSPVMSLVVNPPPGGAIEGEALVFRDSTGQIAFTVPLTNRTTIQPSGETDSIAEGALLSDDGTHALVFSTLASIPAGVIEGTGTDSVRYFDTSGQLWARAASSGREFSRGPTRLVSLDGSRVALVSSDKGSSNPVIDIYSAVGTLVFSVPEGQFVEVDRVELSPSGRYLLIIGEVESTLVFVVRVFDTATSISWDISLDSMGSIPQIRITEDGRFEVRVEATNTVLPPQPQ